MCTVQLTVLFINFLSYSLAFSIEGGNPQFGKCTAPLTYSDCGSACPPTCSSDPSLSCVNLCVPGCFCPSDAPVLHEGKCITREQCPENPILCPEDSGDESEKGFCLLPPSITRRTVAIWTPENPIPIRESACPKDHYVMYGGTWCCHKNARVDFSKSLAYSTYFHCDGYSCCKHDGVSLVPCPHDYGYGCHVSESYWQLPTFYNALYGDTKNIGTSNHKVYQYDNVNGINKLREGDFVIILCGKEYKAFSCDDPKERWSKFCKDQTDSLKVKEINFFVPHHMNLYHARKYCSDHSLGTLATIRSEVDDQLAAKVMLMRKQADQCAFIGFTDEVTSGIWRWMNGQSVTYTNWAYHRTDKGWDQPNNGLGYGEEDYVAMCTFPHKNNKNEFKWFDVGPPRRYFGNTVNFELAYSFCTASAEFVGVKKDCSRPMRPCGGLYTRNSKKSTIKHGEFHLIRCKEGYRMEGTGKISCDDGVTTPIPKCIKIIYAVYEGDTTKPISIPRVFPDEMKVKTCVGDDDDNNSVVVIANYGGDESGGDSIPRGFGLDSESNEP